MAVRPPARGRPARPNRRAGDSRAAKPTVAPWTKTVRPAWARPAVQPEPEFAAAELTRRRHERECRQATRTTSMRNGSVSGEELTSAMIPETSVPSASPPRLTTIATRLASLRRFPGTRSTSAAVAVPVKIPAERPDRIRPGVDRRRRVGEEETGARWRPRRRARRREPASARSSPRAHRTARGPRSRRTRRSRTRP